MTISFLKKNKENKVVAQKRGKGLNSFEPPKKTNGVSVLYYGSKNGC